MICIKTLKCLFATMALLLTAVPSAFGYAVVDGKVTDDAGNVVQLRGVNWFGFETSTHVVHGLWARNWMDMIDQMQSLGFNAVRLPFCPATLHGVAPESIDYDKNTDLRGLKSVEILDKMVAEFSRRGMYVLFDHHTPDCRDISELWYTNSYSQSQWIEDLKFVAKRYVAVPRVLGLDIKNEPHGSATWGTGNSSTDFDKAAELSASAVLEIAPKWLIAVEGIADSSTCSGNIPHFWGGNLEPIACAPLRIPKSQLLLAPHTYGPDVHEQYYFRDPNFPKNMPAIWDTHFGRFSQSYGLLLGEFGGKYGQGNSLDVAWQNALIEYLVERGIDGGFYWSWNPNSGDTGGILLDDWNTVRTDKVNLLRKLWSKGRNT
ncbi:glycoside hydrolase family 5 protein [Paraburkholderia sp. RL17-373-BIF-A]|uniref:glycoside hydrolase family 5 protein n=1 Tax=Paraburkholderia sp. RL17-373-BIF-A TaxID=3031629 RepID=UPI0038B9636C